MLQYNIGNLCLSILILVAIYVDLSEVWWRSSDDIFSETHFHSDFNGIAIEKICKSLHTCKDRKKIILEDYFVEWELT